MLNSPVQKIKERLSIEEVVSSYVKLDKAGVNLKARCPFHNEKSASFFVSPDRGSYYCFGCGAGGDIFSFVEEFEGLDFKGALKLLAGRAGVPLEGYNKEAEGEKERLYRVMEEATKYFVDNLKKNPGALAYLKSRGVNDKSIEDFRVGFALDGWHELSNFLKKKNFTESDIEKAGLSKRGDKPTPSGGVNFYDRFRSRIMFPISDSSGRVIAFSGRSFIPAGSQTTGGVEPAKYLNSPETPIFSKSAVLFGLDKAKDSIRKNNFSILVEGQMDLILSHQVGYKNTIATSGTALSDSTMSKENVVSNLGLVRRLSTNLVLAFDGDTAGINASSRASKIALSLGMDVKVAAMPDGIDPADLIVKSGVDGWRVVIKEAKHVIEFLLAKALKNSDGDTRKAGREIKEKILPYVDMLESSIEKMHFIKTISDASGIPEVALQEDLKKVEQDLKTEKREITMARESLTGVYRKDYILRKLLGIVLWQKTLPAPLVDIDKVLGKLAELLKISRDQVLETAKDNEADFIFEAEVFYGGSSGDSDGSNTGTDIKADVDELLFNFEEERVKEDLAQKMRELYLAEEKGDKEKSNQILKELQILNNKVQEIKNSRKN